ncbi:MAG: ABC1 kinase family protein [Bacteroidia bacterium]
MDEIPSSKIQRTSKFVKTGLKVGTNYLKHYAQKLVSGEADTEALDKANAEDIYEALSELKGSALKAAQMLSMDGNVLPSAYIEQFSKAQYQAPALSGPLVVKTFEQYFGKSPTALFDTFELKAKHAASMGQVHQATKNGKQLAIKIQYPGVGDSVVSDLNMLKPVVKRMFGWRDADLQSYFEEVKGRLVEETDYLLEVRRGNEIAEKCAELPNLRFPIYLKEFSTDRIITMEWINGLHLDAWLATQPSQEARNLVGQTLWNFYNYQIHTLKTMHADAHPGNYLIQENGEVAILDFGCVKEFPEDFYQNYLALMNPAIWDNEHEAELRKLCLEAKALLGNETAEEERFFMKVFKEGVSLLCLPFYNETFDFGDKAYFQQLYEYGEGMAKDKQLRKSAPRGSQHALYLNRTYFGLYNLLHALGATVTTRSYMPKLY